MDDMPPERQAVLPLSTRTVEQTLALARLGVAIAGLALLWLDPATSDPTRLTATGLLVGYALFAVAIGASLRFLAEAGWAFAVGSHLIDVAVAAAITLLADSPQRPFVLFLNFPVVAAAYRWGLVEAVCTAATAVSLLALESLLVNPAAGLAVAPSRPLVRGLYLGALALLAGALAESDKRAQREARLAARVLGEARLGRPLGDSLAAVLPRIARAFGARRAVIVMQQVRTGRCFAQHWEDGGHQAGRPAPAAPRELSRAIGEGLLVALPGMAVVATRSLLRRGHHRLQGVDILGRAVQAIDVELPTTITQRYSTRHVLVVSQQYDERWNVRLFLGDLPALILPLALAQRAQRLAAATGPALYAQVLSSRIGERASQAERARIVRELHDGPVQSLLGVEMELAVLRRRASAQAPDLAAELGRFHDTLKHEVIGLREVFEGVRAGATPNRPIQHDLSDLVSRFAIYTGLDARYVGEHEPVLLPPGTRRELLRITHEALANIRKHSGARRVVIRTAVQPGQLVLHIEDNGRGFRWAGTRTQEELRAAHEGPWTMLERAAVIHATLAITSKPGSGASVELLVPTPVATGTPAGRPATTTPGVFV